MKFIGTIKKDGKWFIAEIPALDMMTQGRTRRSCVAMVKDWFQTMLNKEWVSMQIICDEEKIDVEIYDKGIAEFAKTRKAQR